MGGQIRPDAGLHLLNCLSFAHRFYYIFFKTLVLQSVDELCAAWLNVVKMQAMLSKIFAASHWACMAIRVFGRKRNWACRLGPVARSKPWKIGTAQRRGSVRLVKHPITNFLLRLDVVSSAKQEQKRRVSSPPRDSCNATASKNACYTCGSRTTAFEDVIRGRCPNLS